MADKPGDIFMAEDIYGIGQAVAALKELIKFACEKYFEQGTIKKEEKTKFLKAAQKALNETLRYTGGDPHIRDYKKEIKLSDLWSKVAETAFPLNPELAQRCYSKSAYWANPTRWTDKQIDDAKIHIVQMQQEIGDLLGGKRQIKKRGRTDGK